MRLAAIFASAAALVSFTTSCATDDDDSGATMDVEGDPRDVRVPIPEQDGTHYDFIGGETVIGPGEEKTTCYHMVVPNDIAVGNIEMMQGEFGHHAVIVSSNDPMPPGTAEDCTDQTSYAKFKALLIPVEDPPADHAYWLKAGTPVVLQSHYVNASDEPILTRDVVHARLVEPDKVNTWMAPFTTTALNFEIPATDEPFEITFDCLLDREVDLLYVGGHMHEWGAAFDIELGPKVDELSSIYSVDAWIPDFRDLPPIEIYANDPLKITQGTVLRTTCRWENHTGEPLIFPHEMCVSFGVLAGSKEAYDCRATDF